MGWAAVTPEWVAPSAREVDDAHWLAFQEYAERSAVAAGGVGAALAWVRGGRVGPVTGRDEQPVTEALARAARRGLACVDHDLQRVATPADRSSLAHTRSHPDRQ